MDKKFYNNLIIAFLSQGIAILMGLFTSLILPKFITLENYANWQLFMLYNTYIAIFHFGLNDGIYLTTAGKKIDQIDNNLIGSQFKIISSFQLFLLLIYIAASLIFNINYDTNIILIGTLIYMLLKNQLGYIGFVFQSINETHIYSKSIIIEKIVFLIFTIVNLILGLKTYFNFIVIFNVSTLISLFYILYKGRNFIFSKFLGLKKTFPHFINNIKIGISLMISAMASNFILGNVKFSINNFWGLEIFGKVSLAFSASSLVLIFIQQFSMVLFPSIKIKEKEDQENLYFKLIQNMNLILPLFLIAYYPINYLLKIWLPNYFDALKFLIFLLPVVIVDAKTQMIFFTYMKVFREERKLLLFNLSFMTLSIVLSTINGVFFKNLELLFICYLVVIILRAIALEYYISSKKYNKFDFIQAIIFNTIIIIFVIINLILDVKLAFVTYFWVILMYLISNKNGVKKILERLKKRRK